MTIEEAEKTLKEYKLQIHINTDMEEIDKSAIVKEQIPQAGITVYEESVIYVDI